MSGAYYNEFNPHAAQWLRNLIERGLIADGDVDERDLRDINPDDLRGYTQCHFFAGIGVWSYSLRLAGFPDDRPCWSGSPPCQPFSASGRKGGFADERHLWPHFHHLIRERRPDLLFGEQVASKDGLAWLDLVQSDMEGEDYTGGAFDLCAAGIGAPHIRQRLTFVFRNARIAWSSYAASSGWREERPLIGGSGSGDRTEGWTAGHCISGASSALDHDAGSRFINEGEGVSGEFGSDGQIGRGGPELGRSGGGLACGCTDTLGLDHCCCTGRQGGLYRGADAGREDFDRHPGCGCAVGALDCPDCKRREGQRLLQERGHPNSETPRTSENCGLDDLLGLGRHEGRNPDGEHDGEFADTASEPQSRQLADSDGRNASAEREQSSGEHGLRSQDASTARGSGGGVGAGQVGPLALEHADSRSIPVSVGRSEGRDGERSDCSDADGSTWRPRPTNGFWGNPDWLFCRDGKWRPVESGTFPLVDGAAFRLDSGSAFAGKSRGKMLEGAGNAVVSEQQAHVIACYLEHEADEIAAIYAARSNFDLIGDLL